MASELELVVADDPVREVGERLAAAARAGGHIVLTGGRTPRGAYEIAAGLEPDWTRVEVWWGDERCVPADDERSNYRLAKESLLDRVSPLRRLASPSASVRPPWPPLTLHRPPRSAAPQSRSRHVT